MLTLIRRLALPLMMMTIACAGATAYAQAIAPPSSPPDLSALWPMIGLAIATGWGYAARYLTAAKWTTAHNILGHLLISLVGAIVSGVTPVFQSGHVSGAALAWAAVGAFTTFLAGLNHPPADSQARGSGQAGRASVAALVALAIASAIMFGSVLAMAGCQTAGGQALKSCELGQLPAEEQVVLAEVGTVLMNPSAVLADLLALAAKLGPAQVGCAVAAWDAYLASKAGATPAGSALLASTTLDQRAHALSLTHAYLAAHPSACSGRSLAALGWATAL